MKVVLLHGFTGGPTSWDAVVAGLARGGADSLCLSLLGHAGGPAREAHAPLPTSFEAEVDRLASSLPRGPLHLVGYSLGARLALGMLVRHRVRFESATLIGVHPGLDSAAERAARVQADQALADQLLAQGLPAFVAKWEALPLFETQRSLPPARQRLQRAQRLAHSPEGLAAALRTLSLGSMPSYWDELAQLDLPLNLVVGGRDTKFLALAERMASCLPQARLEVIGSSAAPVGHNVVLEAPDPIVRLILESLNV